jgi:L-histidine N-alpha-methyltransferase
MFLGGTVGNLVPDDVPSFLGAVARALEPGDGFLVGVDLEKDPDVLEAAYDDEAGVTADFNRNVLRVVNARLGGDFDPEAFAHVAFYDRERRWIEMRLRATRAMRVVVRDAGLDLRYAPGDEIRTEISCKYTRASFQARLPGSGLSVREWFEDEGRFALALLSPLSSRPGGEPWPTAPS